MSFQLRFSGFLFACLAAFFVACQGGEKQRRMAQDHLSIASGHVKKCRFRTAVAHLLKAAALSKKDPFIRLALADVYSLMKKKRLAEREYKKALRIRPSFTEARLNLARIYIEKGEAAKALTELQKTESDIIYSNYIKIYGIKALAFFEKGDYKQAEKQLLEMQEMAAAPLDQCFVSLYLGRSNLALRNFSLAEAQLTKALSFCQRAPPLCLEPSFEEQFFLAKVYHLQKKQNKAKHHLKVFLSRTGVKNPLRKKAKKAFAENTADGQKQSALKEAHT